MEGDDEQPTVANRGISGEYFVEGCTAKITIGIWDPRTYVHILWVAKSCLAGRSTIWGSVPVHDVFQVYIALYVHGMSRLYFEVLHSITPTLSATERNAFGEPFFPNDEGFFCRKRCHRMVNTGLYPALHCCCTYRWLRPLRREERVKQSHGISVYLRVEQRGRV